jgi:hypothetical protein
LLEDYNNTIEKNTLESKINIQKIEDESNKKIIDTDTKFYDDRIKLIEDSIGLKTNIINNLINQESLESKTYRQILFDRKTEIGLLQDQIQLFKQSYDAKMKQISLTQTGQQKIMAEAQAWDEYTKSVDDANKKIQEISKGIELGNFGKEKWKTAMDDFKETMVQGTLDVVNQLSTIWTSYIDFQIAEQKRLTDMMLVDVQERRDQQAQNLQNMYDGQLITQAQYNIKVKELDKQAEQEKKALQLAQWEREKQANIKKAIIQGILAVINAYAQAGNPILGAIMAGITAAIIATQIGLMQKEQPPVFAEGGEIKGKSHQEGGVLINAEDGEFVVRKEVVSQPGMLKTLQQMNNSAFTYNNGSTSSSPVPVFKMGGLVIPKPTGMFLPKFQSGGLVSTSNTYITNGGYDGDMLKAIVTEVVNGTTSIPVNVTEYDISKTQRKIGVIEKRSSW